MEYRMLLYNDLDVEIPALPPAGTCLSLSAHLEALSVINTGRNLYFELGLLDLESGTGAIRARILDNFAYSATGVTGTRECEKSLLYANLASAFALWAALSAAAFGGAASLTRFAARPASDGYLFLASKGRLFERHFEVVTEVVARSASATTSSSSTTSGSTEEGAEDISEDILKAGEITLETTCTTSLFECGMTETIVLGTILRFTENGISFSRLLELLLGLFVARIFVRVELNGLLTIGLLDLFERCRLRHL
jgi:hypothetical protein